MDSNTLEKLIVEHFEEFKKTRKHLKQRKKQFEENSRRKR